jgi:hypothetical protein
MGVRRSNEVASHSVSPQPSDGRTEVYAFNDATRRLHETGLA